MPRQLRGVKPASVEKRPKVFIYAPAGLGKTTAALQFPRPYFIDTERGAENDQYLKLLEKVGGSYFFTADFEEITEECLTLLTTKHEYRTIVIDPLTVPWNDLLDECAKITGTDFGRHYGEANKRMKRLLNILLRLDMNVVITAHSKNEYGNNFAVLGQTFDCYKKLDYLFDLVLEIQRADKGRVGVVRKTRLEAFPEGDVFPFTYDEIARRYGKDVLERQAVAVELATPDQTAEIMRLVDLLKIDEPTVNKWLTKAQAGSVADLPKPIAEKIVKNLQKKISGKEK